MTGSMCVSMTGRLTFAQQQNDQRRQNYEYYQVTQRLSKGVTQSNSHREKEKGGNRK